MLPNAELDTQLKQLRSKSAHEWATARFFAATNAAAIAATPPAQRVARLRLAAKASILLVLLIWVMGAVMARELLPTFTFPLLLVAIGIWIAGMHLADHYFVSGSSVSISATREDLV